MKVAADMIARGNNTYIAKNLMASMGLGGSSLDSGVVCSACLAEASAFAFSIAAALDLLLSSACKIALQFDAFLIFSSSMAMFEFNCALSMSIRD